jgi:hypothetical protein
MTALRDNSGFRGDTPTYWRQHADRARKLAEQMQRRTKYARPSLSKRRILNLAKRYDQMANLAEERVKKHDRNI